MTILSPTARPISIHLHSLCERIIPVEHPYHLNYVLGICLKSCFMTEGAEPLSVVSVL